MRLVPYLPRSQRIITKRKFKCDKRQVLLVGSGKSALYRMSWQSRRVNRKSGKSRKPFPSAPEDRRAKRQDLCGVSILLPNGVKRFALRDLTPLRNYVATKSECTFGHPSWFGSWRT
jgi:hypothetical protein